MTELNEVLKHAQLAHFDNELSSFGIVMILKGQDPEIHLAVSQADVHDMNAGADMLKLEILKVMAMRAEERKPRG